MLVSDLIAIATETALQATPIRLDWRELQTTAAADTILLLLKNGNVIAIIEKGFHGDDEIVVSDPLYRDGEIFYMPRGDLKRLWDGDALVVTPRPADSNFFARSLTAMFPAGS